jgi:hypothetical protein
LVVSVESLATFASLASPFILVASVLIAARAIRQNIDINRRNKRADVIAHCNNRYAELFKLKIDIYRDIGNLDGDLSTRRCIDRLSIPDWLARKIEAYYAQYWGLKSDQFDYWLSGWIDVETFFSWFYSALRRFHENECLGHMNFKAGWQEVGKKDNKIVNDSFLSLIVDLISIEQTAPEGEFGVDIRTQLFTVLKSLEEYSREWRQKISGSMLKGDMTFADYEKSLQNPKGHGFGRFRKR